MSLNVFNALNFNYTLFYKCYFHLKNPHSFFIQLKVNFNFYILSLETNEQNISTVQYEHFNEAPTLEIS